MQNKPENKPVQAIFPRASLESDFDLSADEILSVSGAPEVVNDPPPG